MKSPLRRMMRTCRRKIAHETIWHAADRQAADWRNNRIVQHVYLCSVCGVFHLTGVHNAAKSNA